MSTHNFLALLSTPHFSNHNMTNLNKDFLFACLPLLPPCILLLQLIGNPIAVVQQWITKEHLGPPPPVSSQLLAYLLVAILGFKVTDRLVPSIQQYTLRKGISGKDLGKKGTKMEDKDV